MSEAKVAVVGGTGFLGSHLVLELLEAGYTPVAVARTPEKMAKVLPGVDVEVRKGDLTDLDSLRTALKGCEMVHSVAAMLTQVFTSTSRGIRDAAIRTNVDGTLNVLRAAEETGARRVIVTSSTSTRYQKGGALANEDSPPTDLRVIGDAYVESKLREEEAILNFSRETDLEVVLILPAGLVGPRDVGPSLLGNTLLGYLNGGPEGRGALDGGIPIVDVRDAARAHVAAMERGRPGGSYLVVAGTTPMREWEGMLNRLTGLPERPIVPGSIALSMAWLAEVMSRLTGKAPRFTRNMVRHVVINQQYDGSRAERELGITCRPIETSLRDTLLWYVDNGWVDEPERLAVVVDRAKGGLQTSSKELEM